MTGEDGPGPRLLAAPRVLPARQSVRYGGGALSGPSRAEPSRATPDTARLDPSAWPHSAAPRSAPARVSGVQGDGSTNRSIRRATRSSKGAPNWVICKGQHAATDGASYAQNRRSRSCVAAPLIAVCHDRWRARPIRSDLWPVTSPGRRVWARRTGEQRGKGGGLPRYYRVVARLMAPIALPIGTPAKGNVRAAAVPSKAAAMAALYSLPPSPTTSA